MGYSPRGAGCLPISMSIFPLTACSLISPLRRTSHLRSSFGDKSSAHHADSRRLCPHKPAMVYFIDFCFSLAQSSSL